MADIRINALATTATTSASDDVFAIDGTINGTRKMSAATPAFLTSVTVPTITSAAGANLNVNVGTAASDIEVHNALTDATSSTAAGTKFAGGVAIAKKLNVGTEIAGATAVLSSTATAADYLVGASGPSVKSSLAARAPAQGLVFDGTASASFSGVPAFGTGGGTVVVFCTPRVTAAVTPRLLWTTAQNTQFFINAGVPTFYTAGGSVTSAALTAGKAAMIAAVINGDGTAVAYTNAIAGTSGAVTANITDVPAVLGGNTANYFDGSLRVLIYNRALTAAEVLALYESGAPAAGDFNNASNTAINTSAWANNSGSYDSLTGASATGFTAVNASGVASALLNNSTTLSFKKGQRARCTGTLTLNNGKTVIPGIGFDGGGTVVSFGAAGAFSVEFVAGSTQVGNGNIIIYSDGDADFTLADLSVTNIGLLLAPESNAPGNGYQWKDMSGNKADITLPATGVAWALPDRRPNSVRGTLTWAGTHAALQLNSTTAGFPVDAVITDIITKASAASTGSGIVIGASSSAGRYVSANAYTTAKKAHTLAARTPPGTSFGSGDLDLYVDPDTNNYTGSIEVEAFYILTQGNP